ncbi:MAG: hypothetical protein A2Y17_10195 [Clostridiales bacterium GWF2_38_85]|nr:MAG: hypothetical protein A2Y17_10195 [Clostridiales bacterium GWF2_38_85]
MWSLFNGYIFLNDILKIRYMVLHSANHRNGGRPSKYKTAIALALKCMRAKTIRRLRLKKPQGLVKAQFIDTKIQTNNDSVFYLKFNCYDTITRYQLY